MSSGAETATFGIGAAASVASWVLCITSDGEYAAAAKAYNAQLPVEDDDPLHDPLETGE